MGFIARDLSDLTEQVNLMRNRMIQLEEFIEKKGFKLPPKQEKLDIDVF
jgi:hypothetical protein